MIRPIVHDFCASLWQAAGIFESRQPRDCSESQNGHPWVSLFLWPVFGNVSADRRVIKMSPRGTRTNDVEQLPDQRQATAIQATIRTVVCCAKPHNVVIAMVTESWHWEWHRSYRLGWHHNIFRAWPERNDVFILLTPPAGTIVFIRYIFVYAKNIYRGRRCSSSRSPHCSDAPQRMQVVTVVSSGTNHSRTFWHHRDRITASSEKFVHEFKLRELRQCEQSIIGANVKVFSSHSEVDGWRRPTSWKCLQDTQLLYIGISETAMTYIYIYTRIYPHCRFAISGRSDQRCCWRWSSSTCVIAVHETKAVKDSLTRSRLSSLSCSPLVRRQRYAVCTASEARIHTDWHLHLALYSRSPWLSRLPSRLLLPGCRTVTGCAFRLSLLLNPNEPASPSSVRRISPAGRVP
jgi:hypothetical protein